MLSIPPVISASAADQKPVHQAAGDHRPLHHRQRQPPRRQHGNGQQEAHQDVKPENELHRFHRDVQRAGNLADPRRDVETNTEMIPMKTALTGSMMLRSMNSMRRSRRAGSGAGISNSAGSRFSHWAWLGFMVNSRDATQIENFTARHFQARAPRFFPPATTGRRLRSRTTTCPRPAR